MKNYIKRELFSTLEKYINIFPVTLVTGPRQSGKSTFLKEELKDYTYITFDDYRISSFFINDPEGFFLKYKSKVIFDEVQKVPEIFNYIKKQVDDNRNEYGKYVLSGSNQFIMLKKVTESLAGRIGLLELLPFQRKEIPLSLRDQSIYKGSYPELSTRNYQGDEEWYSSYIETYLNKDIQQMSDIKNLRDFRRFVELLAANAKQVLNTATYAKELGISVPTIKRWISILESSYIIFLLQPYHENTKKRVIKRPKVYFYDTGLVSYITGIQNEKHFNNGPMAGALFENYIISEVLKYIKHNNIKAKLSFLRTNNMLEIDLIINCISSDIYIEIKKTATSNINMFNHIKTILNSRTDKIYKNKQGYLVYRGENFEYGNQLIASNYDDFLINQLPKMSL